MRVMEVVVTTGVVKVQSCSQIVTTSKWTPSFYRPDAILVAQPAASEHQEGNDEFTQNLYISVL